MPHENTLRSTPKDVFLHLFNIFTFYLSIVAFIMLLTNYVEALFPDPLNYYFGRIHSAVRWGTSVILVALPAYIGTAWMFARDFAKVPAKRELKLRKWLVHFTLFISAITIIIDLMIFVYRFMNGDMTIQFMSKVLIVLLVAVAVFGYYLWDLKREDLKSKVPKKVAFAVSAVVLISIIAGLFIIGTPMEQRSRRFDEQRINDLQIIQNEVINYWTKKKSLPENLGLLEDNLYGFSVPMDPGSKVSYEYMILEDLKFELCAVFETTADNSINSNTRYSYPYGGPYDKLWSHQSERTCFEKVIDPDMYKNIDGALETKPPMIR
ncbi:MAG: DUF5671 domain-containing protein [bacterium]|nr:DUF5671 domain-containing protein [bacterium]